MTSASRASRTASCSAGRLMPSPRFRRRRHAGHPPPRPTWTAGQPPHPGALPLRVVARARSHASRRLLAIDLSCKQRRDVLEPVDALCGARRSGADRARRTSSTTPAANIAAVRSAIRCAVEAAGRVRPATTVGWRVSADQRALSETASECPDSASSSARTTRRRSLGGRGGRGRITAASVACAPAGPTLVVQALCRSRTPSGAWGGSGIRRAPRACRGRSRRTPPAPGRGRGSRRSQRGRGPRYSATEPSWLGSHTATRWCATRSRSAARRLVGQDRQPAVELHRVARDDLAAEHVGQLERDGALARGGGPEDRDDRHRV